MYKDRTASTAFFPSAVLKTLARLDTGVGSSSFFWGRWTRTSELVVIAIGAPGAGGGGVAGPVSERPIVENLLVEFDKNEHVVQWDVMDDDDLLEKMAPILKRARDTRGQTARIPSSCRFQWHDLTRVKAQPNSPTRGAGL